jgi:hypothetical protein
MSDEADDLTMDATMPEAADSDALLVAAYVKQASVEELRRYIAMDLVTALQPLTKESIKTAQDIEKFLLGKTQGPRAVE